MNRTQMTFRSVMKGYVEHIRQGVNLNDALFKLAQACANVNEFLAKCRIEEEWVTSLEANQTRMDNIPQAWVQAKSNIKRAWERGLAPTDYPSLSKYRVAKAEVGRATGTSTEQALKDATAGHVTGVTQVMSSSLGLQSATDLGDIEELIRPLSELSRARCIKRMTTIAEDFRNDHDKGKVEGQRRKDRIPPTVGKVVSL